MSDYTELKKILHKFSEDITNECKKVSEDISDSVESMIKKADSAKALQDKVNKKPKKKCPAGKIINPKTGRCINKPKEKTQKKRGRPKKSDKSPPVSKYYQKQYEKYVELIYEGVEYVRNIDTNEVYDPNDGEVMGKYIEATEHEDEYIEWSEVGFARRIHVR